MIDRGKWRPLTPGRHIRQPEIGHHRNAGLLGKHVRRSDLARDAITRFMKHRLTVKADDANVGGRHTGFSHQHVNSINMDLCQIIGNDMFGVGRTAIAKAGPHAFAQFRRIRHKNRLPGAAHFDAIGFNEGCVHPIKRGTTHHADCCYPALCHVVLRAR